MTLTPPRRSSATNTTGSTELRKELSALAISESKGPARSPTLLPSVAALPLSSPGAQLLAVSVAIWAARGGVGNITGIDLRPWSRPTRPRSSPTCARLSWQIPDVLLDADPETPVPVTLPALNPTTQAHRLGRCAGALPP
ncbi:hypothetical protein ACFWWB_35755 [Streptomyces sp. NPDC058690]|uniref:hypothetical protein n=1 Tax=Streptomyces sp. NPDC058690 TaxID=3346600 RepID=UPI003649DC03